MLRVQRTIVLMHFEPLHHGEQNRCHFAISTNQYEVSSFAPEPGVTLCTAHPSLSNRGSNSFFSSEFFVSPLSAHDSPESDTITQHCVLAVIRDIISKASEPSIPSTTVQGVVDDFIRSTLSDVVPKRC